MPIEKIIPHASGGQYVAPEDVFQIMSTRPAVRFLTQAVQPPSIVYVNVDDDIVVGAASSLPGEVLTVSYRLLKANGDIVLGQFTVSPASDRSVKVYQESLTEGFLLSVSCKAKQAVTRGQTFARVFLSNPSLGNGTPSYMLMADYVTTAMAPAFPNGRQLSPVEGPGFINHVPLSAAPLGSDFTAIIPTNARWRLISILGTLITSAVVGNRSAGLKVAIGGQTVGIIPAPVAQPASSTFIYTWGVNSGPYGDVTNTWAVPLLSLPILPQQGTSFVGSFTTGIQAGDDWSGIVLAVEEWLDNV